MSEFIFLLKLNIVLCIIFSKIEIYIRICVLIKFQIYNIVYILVKLKYKLYIYTKVFIFSKTKILIK